MKFLKTLRRIFLLGLLTLLIPVLLSRSIVDLNSPIEQVRRFSRQIEFDYWNWTLEAMLNKFSQNALNLPAYITPENQKKIVLSTFETIWESQVLEAQINQIYTDPEINNPDEIAAINFQNLADTTKQLNLIEPIAEEILQTQLSAVLAQEGLGFLGETIPPVLYRLTPLPSALIVSPRDTIRQDANLSLNTEVGLEERINLEAEIDQSLNVSSLITDIGGVGTYPTMVMQSSNFTWVAGVVGHEWTHNFLTLRPLGLSYSVNGDLRTINETTASISEEELKWALIERYYPEFLPEPAIETQQTPAETTENEPAAFDFAMEMYITRTRTDELLAEGKIEEAESYMEQRRLFLYENGYHIRKLNQAYFAFHSAYVNDPSDGADGQTGASGTDPVGPLVWRLRENSDSLADFLNRISWVSSLADLQKIVNQN